MRICLIFEGSYPYVHGGVSSWAHEYIKSMPEHEFILWTIAASTAQKGNFKYELPQNVSEIHEVFLDESLSQTAHRLRPLRLSQVQCDGLSALLRGDALDWLSLIKAFHRQNCTPAEVLQSPDLMNVILDLCREQFQTVPFSDFFHMVRSLLLPLLWMLKAEIPSAELYHALSTGYGGLLGSIASITTGNPLVLTEHGIYAREREEELIQATWCPAVFRNNWISMFYQLSKLTYQQASQVTSLFDGASQTQLEHGCPPEKRVVIPNGIHVEQFESIPLKDPNGWVDIGAVVRFAPIKDIITLIYAFHELHAHIPYARLHILGGVNDAEYAQKCYNLAEELSLDKEHLIFTGFVKTTEYMERLDFTVLSSLSEGQPLSVLESLAAERPCVCTNVGCCRELLGSGSERCGLCVPPMQPERLSEAMEWMCTHTEERLEMGRQGKAQILAHFRQEQMIAAYQAVYRGTAALAGASVRE